MVGDRSHVGGKSVTRVLANLILPAAFEQFRLRLECHKYPLTAGVKDGKAALRSSRTDHQAEEGIHLRRPFPREGYGGFP